MTERDVQPQFKTFAPKKPRKGLRAKPRPLTPEQKRIKAEVFERDGGCQLVGHGPCFGPLTPHHRRKASQGGGYTTENLVALCAHHNEQLEADPDLAALGVELGLVIRTSFDGGDAA